MESSWQVKCTSPWQSLTPVASSSQLQTQELMNQMWNPGHCLYPHITQEPNTTARAVIQEAIDPKLSNFCHSGLHQADPGNSFLSLLSGSSSLLQSNLQQFSSPKPFVTSGKITTSGQSFMVGAAGSVVSHAPSGIFSQNLSFQNPKIGGNCCQAVSGSSLLDVLQAADLNHQSLAPAKAIFLSGSGSEKIRDVSSLTAGWTLSTHPSNAGKMDCTSTQTSQKTSLDSSSISWESWNPTTVCPRVFCLGASGTLLFSNTGLLGVICSCHGLHMSIARFAEHSGFHDVNPGDAVHMDSGETIVQWRRLYFHKFGIRVPEENNGWDWPEGRATTSGMVKCSVLATNTSKNSDLSNLAASTGGLAAFWQSLNNGAFPQNQNTRQKLVDELSFDGKQRNAQENCNFLHRGLIGASQNYMSVVSDNLIPAFSVSGSSTVSKFISTRDTDNGCQSNSTYTDSISQTGQSFMSHHLQNSKTIGNNSDVSLFYGIKEGGVVDRDAVSSSIELRLGQPSPQSQTLGNSVFPASRSPLLDPRGDPQRSFLPQQLIHNCNSNMVEEHSQYLQHTAGSSNFSARRGQSTLNFVNHAPGVNTARDSFTIEQLTPDADRSVGNSVLLSQFKTPVDQRMHSKAATGGTRGIHVMPRKPHHESRIAKYDLTNIPYSRNDASETELSIIKLDLQKHRGEGKGVAFIADGLCVPSEPNFEFRTKHVDSSTNCNRVGRTGQSSCSMAHGKSSHPCQFSGLHPEASDGINAINHSGKIPGIGFHQQLDHVFLRSTSFPMDSGPTLPRQPLSVGNSGMTSFGSIASSAFSNKEATCTNPLLDDNLRMLAFGHILSNQGHSNASPVKNQDQGRLHTSCSEKMLDSIFDASSSKERQNGLPVNREDASGVAIKSFQSGFTHWVGGDAESLAPVAANGLTGQDWNARS